MENLEQILQSLESFPQLTEKADYTIPIELEEYINHVAKTGDPVFQWPLVKPLIKEKMVKVIADFHEGNSEIPEYPNVDKFHYENMKATLLEKIDWFRGAPFTIQRIAELLSNPTKEYNRVDKYMRALEKNVYVVTIREPGMPQPPETNTYDDTSFILNGVGDIDSKSEVESPKDVNGTSSQDNMDVDVTSGDSTDENNLVSAEINVHDDGGSDTNNESSDLTESSSSDEELKTGQTRKLEDDGHEEHDLKRFKSHQDLSTMKSSDNSVSEYEAKLLMEMELEETINNKIESFDSVTNSSTEVNVSGLESIAVSQDPALCSEESVEEKVDVTEGVNDTSDMDLSDGVTPPIEVTEDLIVPKVVNYEHDCNVPLTTAASGIFDILKTQHSVDIPEEYLKRRSNESNVVSESEEKLIAEDDCKTVDNEDSEVNANDNVEVNTFVDTSIVENKEIDVLFENEESSDSDNREENVDIEIQKEDTESSPTIEKGEEEEEEEVKKDDEKSNTNVEDVEFFSEESAVENTSTNNLMEEVDELEEECFEGNESNIDPLSMDILKTDSNEDVCDTTEITNELKSNETDNIETSKSVMSENEEIEETPTQDEEMEETPTQDEEIEETPTQDEEIEEKSIQDEEIEETSTQDEEIEETSTQDEEIKETSTQDEEIKETSTQDEEIEESLTQDEDIEQPSTEDSEVTEEALLSEVAEDALLEEPISQTPELNVEEPSEEKEEVAEEAVVVEEEKTEPIADVPSIDSEPVETSEKQE